MTVFRVSLENAKQFSVRVEKVEAETREQAWTAAKTLIEDWSPFSITVLEEDQV